MKRFFPILIFIAGCSVSIIKLEFKHDDNLIQQFGRNASKTFFVDDTLILPLKLKMKLETHGNFPFSSFLAYGRNLITSDLSGRVYAFDLSTGKRSGFLKFDGSISVSPIINRIYMIIPVTLIPEPKTSIIVYDFINGKEIQSIKFDGIIQTELVRNDDFFIAVTEDGRIRKINYMGEILFNLELRSFTHSSGAMNDKFYFIGNDRGEISKIDLLDNRISATKKISDEPLRHTVIYKDKIFTSGEDGFVYELAALDLNMKNKIFFGKKIEMHPVVNDDILYCGTTGGYFSAYDLKSNKIIWSHKFDNSFAASPLIVGNKIVAPLLNKKVYIFDKVKGSILDSLQYDVRVKSTPLYYRDLLITGSDNGQISVYGSN